MATETVTRNKRKECWESRDMFYACLDSNGSDESKCTDLQTKYEAACPKAWRQHYANRRKTAPLRGVYRDKQQEGVAITSQKA